MSLLRLIVILRCWMLIASQVACRFGSIANKADFTPTAALYLKSQKWRTGAFMSNAGSPWTTIQCRLTALHAVPKKKPSKRRTRIRKTAWMKRFPLNWKRPMMLDMFDVVKYTDGTLTKARTTHESWLNLPKTSLDGEHFLTKEIRPRW